MRVFIAIPVPVAIIAQLRKAQQELQKLPARQTFPEQFHITFIFFADASEAFVAELQEKLAALVFDPFTATLGHVGVFPSEKQPRVIWVGVEPADQFAMLYRDLHTDLDIKQEKRDFMPHLTLSRVKKIESVFNLDKIAVDPLNWTVNEIVLYKSELTPDGPEYEELASVVSQQA